MPPDMAVWTTCSGPRWPGCTARETVKDRFARLGTALRPTLADSSTSCQHAVTSAPLRGVIETGDLSDAAGRTIVLTGAAGALERALLAELAGRPVIALTHRELVAAVESLGCDITQPRLGLDPAAYRELADRADVIIHCAARTDFKVAAGSQRASTSTASRT